MKASRYRISTFISRAHNMPCEFVAIVLRESAKALELFGHGTTGAKTNCVKCGRALTHPVSVLCGIGPECGGHFWDESVLGPFGFTEVHAEQLRRMVEERVVGPVWVPKSMIRSVEPVEEDIQQPVNTEKPHDKGIEGAQKGPEPAFTSVSAPKRQAAFDGASGHIQVRFPYDPADVARARELPGRRFNSKNARDKHWECPVSVAAVELLQGWDFDLTPALWDWYDEHSKPLAPAVLEDSPLLARLYPFQREGVACLETRKGNLLIADEMGLGKTVQALAYVERHPEIELTVVVCPASLKLNWAKEAASWTTRKISIGAGTKTLSADKRRTEGTGKILILNYDIVGAWRETIAKYNPGLIILDEGHYIKNKDAMRTKALMGWTEVDKDTNKRVRYRGLCEDCPKLIALTGTPVTNRPLEIYNLIKLVEPTLFPKAFEFKMRYCGPRANRFATSGYDFVGASHIEELHEKLTASCMLRRKKVDVLKDLPAKIRTVVPLEINNRAEYKALESGTVDELEAEEGTNNQANALAKIEALKQCSVRGKLAAAIEWIEDYLAEDPKLVVFCHHKSTVEALEEAFKGRCVTISGKVANAAREEAKVRFQTDPKVELFIGTGAAKEGLTLTAASSTCFLELWWTPGDHDQAEDRVHRIGQEADSVNAYYLVADGTIEVTIAALIDKKRKVVTGVTDGETVADESLLTELLRSLKEGK